jgi:predicted metalloendopeptidase
VWHLIQRLPGYLPEAFVDAVMVLNKAELGVTTISQRWDRCISKAQSAFGFVTAALYVDKTFPPESKALVSKPSTLARMHNFVYYFFFYFFFENTQFGEVLEP